MVVLRRIAFLFLVQSQVWAQTPTATVHAPGEPPKSEEITRKNPSKVSLSQADVAKLVLQQSDRTTEANLRSDLPRKTLSDAERKYDWTVTGETYYEVNQPILMNAPSDLKDRTTSYSLKLTKPWSTGTTTTLEWNRKSLLADFNPSSTSFSTYPSSNNRDEIGISIAQSLLKNSFGMADRATLNAARKNLESAQTVRGYNLQNLVLDGLRYYWAAYVAQENLKEALHAREAYQKLVENVRRKSGYGYAAGGELSQAQAESETRLQNVKKASVNYLQSEDVLLSYLNFPSGSEIDFKIENEIPVPPKLNPIEIEKLRQLRAQSLTKEAADLSLKAAKANNNPDLSLIAQMYGAGVDQNSSTSFGNSLSGANPRYYIGLKLTHQFGSNALGEDQFNAELSSQIEQIRTNRLKVDMLVNLETQEKYVQSAYAVVLSAKEQKIYREKALKEIQAYYNQGRVAIRDLIQAMNDAFQTEVTYSQSVGDYQVALASWAAQRDELIPDASTNRK